MDAKAKEILIRAKKDVFSANLGEHLTPLRGDGLDFNEIADYNYGDDVRKINWKASAKSNALKINIFNEERELNIVVALIMGGSMLFGTKRLKSEVATEVAALLAFSALSNDDRHSGIFFSNKEEKFFRPTKDESIVYEMVESALGFEYRGKEGDMRSFVEFIEQTIKEKSLIFVIGDFYGEVDFSTIAHKHELYALIVRDMFEEDPAFYGEYELIDPNSLERANMNIDALVLNEYKAKLKAHDAKLEEHFLEHRITYGKIYSDDDLFVRLSEIVKG